MASALTCQPGHDAGAIGLGAVLADLPLALDARDRDLDADDALHLGCDEWLGRVAHRPRRGAALFLRRRQVVELAAQPRRASSTTRGRPQACTVT
jgi:hypothetical protein